MSEEDYEKLPENFRKWKKELLKNNPQLINQNQGAFPVGELDSEYMAELASTIAVGSRCKLENGHRGEVSYVGKVPDLGLGYFVGVRLDEPYGNSNGTIK
jgi:tubulin-folding cofactor B